MIKKVIKKKTKEETVEERKEFIKRIKQIELKIRTKVNHTFAGEHLSLFKGVGIEFDEVRPYIDGDDAKSIDWKVTARTNSPHVKVFQEERELIFMILLDISSSNLFGSGSQNKQSVASEIAGILAFSTIKNRDKIGLISFTDRVEHYLPPQKKQSHAFKIIKESLFIDQANKKSNLSNALNFLAQIQKKKSVVFIISDLLYNDDYQKLLKKLSLKHSFIIIHIQDDLEQAFPNVGLLSLEDIESNQSIVVNTASKDFRKSYEKFYQERNHNIEKFFKSQRIKYINIHTKANYFDELSLFFRKIILK